MLCEVFPQVSVKPAFLTVTSKQQLAASKDALNKHILYPLVAFSEFYSLFYNIFKNTSPRVLFRKVVSSPSTQIVQTLFDGNGRKHVGCGISG